MHRDGRAVHGALRRRGRRRASSVAPASADDRAGDAAATVAPAGRRRSRRSPTRRRRAASPWLPETVKLPRDRERAVAAAVDGRDAAVRRRRVARVDAGRQRVVPCRCRAAVRLGRSGPGTIVLVIVTWSLPLPSSRFRTSIVVFDDAVDRSWPFGRVDDDRAVADPARARSSARRTACAAGADAVGSRGPGPCRAR